MNTAKILENLYTLQNTKLNDNQKDIINAIIKDVTEDIAKTNAKTSGNSEKVNAAFKILKMNKGLYRGRLDSALVGEKQIIANGYQAIRLNQHLQINAEKDEQFYDTFNRIIEDSRKNVHCGKMVDAPTIAEIKTFIKTRKAEAKANRKSLYNIPFEIYKDIYVDALLLVNMLAILPNAKITVYDNNKRPYYIESCGVGDGIILGLRIKQD